MWVMPRAEATRLPSLGRSATGTSPNWVSPPLSPNHRPGAQNKSCPPGRGDSHCLWLIPDNAPLRRAHPICRCCHHGHHHCPWAHSPRRAPRSEHSGPAVFWKPPGHRLPGRRRRRHWIRSYVFISVEYLVVCFSYCASGIGENQPNLRNKIFPLMQRIFAVHHAAGRIRARPRTAAVPSRSGSLAKGD